jgi:superfamily II DNA or RNA helicase
MATLNINDRWSKLSEEQEKTIIDAYEKIDKYGKVMIIRPTGFGKTYLLVEKFAKEYLRKYPDKKVAYIYPLDIIVSEIKGDKITKNEDGTVTRETNKYMKDGILTKKNIDFISYNMLTKKFHTDGDNTWRDYFKDDYSLIILDEVHRAGSESFATVYDTIQDLINPNGIHLVGVTATPNRMDDDDDKPPVIDRIFDGIKTYKYELDDAIKDKLIPDLVMQASSYQMDEFIEDLRTLNKQKYGHQFDEDSFNIEVGKARKTLGTEGDYIYTALPLAGYDLKQKKYYKFIVFFNGIQDMADRGPEVEEWFNSAFNDVAKEREGLRKGFNIRSYYIASSDIEECISKVVNEKSDNRTFFKKTKKVETIAEEDYNVDLLFTVNMINMGYHVENITGIMMLRGTKSEITYYQQLGRALSVRALYNPIIYDMTNNYKEKFWFKKDKLGKRGPLTGVGEGSDNKLDISGLEIKETEFFNVFDTFMERWGGGHNQSIVSKIEYYYVERHMPIYMLATILGESCTKTAKLIINNGFELADETNQYNMLEKNAMSLAEKIRSGSKDSYATNRLKKQYNTTVECIRRTFSPKATSSKSYFIRREQANLYDSVLRYVYK